MNTDLTTANGHPAHQPDSGTNGPSAGKQSCVGSVKFAEYCSDIAEIVELVDRFPNAPEPAANEVTKHTTAKWITMLALPACNADNETDFEDWCDIAAAKARQLRPSMVVLRDALVVNATPLISRVLRNKDDECFEDFVDASCAALFHSPRYVWELEQEIFLGKRHPSVLAAESWFIASVSRYVRLVHRHKWTISLSNPRLRLSVLSSVPAVVEDAFYGQGNLPPVSVTARQLFTLLRRVESSLLLKNGGSLPESRRIASALTAQPAASARQSAEGCYSCGKTDHIRRDCPHRAHRCKNCGIVGHISAACRSVVARDNFGKLRYRRVEMPSRDVAETFKDRTTRDKMGTATGILHQLSGKAEKQQQRSRDRRVVRRQRAGKPVRSPRPTPELQAQTVDEPVDFDMEIWSIQTV